MTSKKERKKPTDFSRLLPAMAMLGSALIGCAKLQPTGENQAIANSGQAGATLPQVQSITANPVPGTYAGAQTVTLSTTTSGAIICYSTSGSASCNTGKTGCQTGTLYSAPVAVTGNSTLQAIACAANMVNSPLFSGTYTLGGDTTAPTILSVTPNDAATLVAITTQVVVTFSEAMNPATITVTSNTSCTGSIQVSANNFTNCIAGTIALSAGNNVATFTPSATLQHGITYKVRVTAAAQDLAGNTITTVTQTTGFTATTTLATLNAGCGGTLGITVASTGDIYTSHNNSTICRSNSTSSMVLIDSGLNIPRQIVIDGDNLYIANSGGNNILRLNVTTLVLTTLVTGLNDPTSLAMDSTYLYVGENLGSRVRKITKGGVITATMGDGTCDFSQHNDYSDKTAASTKFCSVKGIFTATPYGVYIADQYSVRWLDLTFTTSRTLSGASTQGNINDPTPQLTGSMARYGNINGLTYDNVNQKLYIADTGNGAIRQAAISYPQVVTTFASSLPGIWAITHSNGFLYYVQISSTSIGKIPVQ